MKRATTPTKNSTDVERTFHRKASVNEMRRTLARIARTRTVRTYDAVSARNDRGVGSHSGIHKARADHPR